MGLLHRHGADRSIASCNVIMCRYLDFTCCEKGFLSSAASSRSNRMVSKQSYPPIDISAKLPTTTSRVHRFKKMTDHADGDDIPQLIPGETRIRDEDGFVGTVVYVGPVASAKNAKEVYAGIVWDDASRGKHDGSVLCRTTNQLVRHFGGCGPTQGSFLRIHKIDRGVPLTSELLHCKYVEMQAPVIAPNNLLPHTARTSSGRDKPIEFLGELQIRQRQQLDDIHKVSLRREGISRSAPLRKGNDDTLLYENIRDVDLAGNLLCHWSEVLKIMQQFPNLCDFSVAYNRIRDVGTTPVTRFDQLQVLNLNHCGIQSFQTFLWVADSMPNLESLCMASSDLSDMEQYPPLDEQHFQRLRVLDCTDCRLSSWTNQVTSFFGKLPMLEQLSLDDNPISSIPSQQDSFPSLRSLQLAGTAIATWTDLDGINSISVQSLRFKNTPITATLGQGEIRFLCIARVPGLLYLNGSVVSSKERTEAERRYVTMVAQLLVKLEQRISNGDQNRNNGNDNKALVEEQTNQLLAEHPQYHMLLEKHKGLVLPTAMTMGNGVNADGTSLVSTVCNVTISSMAASSCSMEPVIRRLPGSLTVGRLKALCARVFGLDVDLMSLHYKTESDAFPIELGNDDNTLSYYGVCDGAEILMNEIDLEARRREAERLSQDQNERMIQQERELMALQQIKQRNEKHQHY